VKLLLELSMECQSLARAEALSAATALGGSPKVVREEPGILVIETDADPEALGNRLGLCHYVNEWLSSCGEGDVEDTAKGIDVMGPIRVRSTKIGERSLDLASTTRKVGAIIGKTRGVDLHRPATEIRVVFSEGAHFARVISSIDRSSFEKRKNRYMPFVYPASLHPKYARALVNLTQMPVGGRLLDPFCGTGAILAEGSMIGLKAIGADFSERMIEGSRKNLDHLKLSADLKLCDVGEIPHTVGRVDGIATDPPYGRSTSTDGERIPELYRRSFDAFSAVLKSGAKIAIVVPDIDLVRNQKGFRLLESHGLWVHRSLTRNFCVFEST
jgi:tRNA (guanine10-N2)-dimethyltransferase